MDDYVFEELDITEDIIDVKLISYYKLKTIEDILKEFIDKPNKILYNLFDKYKEIKKLGENDIILPRWIIPVVTTNIVYGFPENKLEKTVALIKELNNTIGLLDYKDKMNKLTNCYFSTERGKNIVNIRKSLSDNYSEYSRDALTKVEGNFSYLSSYRIHSSEYNLKYIYSEFVDIKINKTAFFQDTNFYLHNEDILEREYIKTYINNYNVNSYLKIPVNAQYLRKNHFMKKTLNSCEGHQVKPNNNCLIKYNELKTYLKNFIKYIYSRAKKYNIKSYRGIYKLFKYLDLDITLKSNIVNKLLNGKATEYYEPMLFFPPEYYVQYNEIWDTIRHLYNNINYSDTIFYYLYNSNDGGNLYLTVNQENHDIIQINNKINKLNNMRENILAQEIPPLSVNEMNMKNEKLKVINDQLYIYENNKLELYNNYIKNEKNKLIDNTIKYLENLKSGHYTLNKDVAYNKLIINNDINKMVKQIRLNIDAAVYRPTEMFCFVRNNIKYRNIRYLSKLFYINEQDKCILIETGEELWCKHEIYNIEDCLYLDNDIKKCKYCETVFEEKINAKSGFINGKPNLIQSGSLNYETNILSIIINVLINNFFKRMNEEYKNKILVLLDDYYGEYDKINSILKNNRIKESELVKKINISYIQRAVQAFKTYRENNRENTKVAFDFHINNTENYINTDIINKHYALQYFYIFNDLTTKIIAIYELITNIRVKSLASNWKSYWNIGFLELDKKYNYDFFYNIYYTPLDKELIKEKYSNLFYVYNSLKTKIIKKNIDKNNLVNEIINQNRFVFKGLTEAEIISPEFKSYAIALDNLITYDIKVDEISTYVDSMPLYKINFDKKLNECYIVKSTVNEYDNLLFTEKNNISFIEPSLCITGMLINNNSMIYDNYEYNKFLENKNSLYNAKFNELEANIKTFLITKEIPAKPEMTDINNEKNKTKIIHNLKKQNLMNYYYVLPNENKATIIPNGFFPPLYKNKINLDKKNVKDLLKNIYNNQNLEKNIAYFNNIYIKIDDKKYTKVIKFGDFLNEISQSKLLKKKKNELNNVFIKNKYNYKSIPINKTSSYENSYSFNYSANIKDDLNQISKLLNLPISDGKVVSLSELNKNDNVIVKQYNYNNYYNMLYKSWYNTFVYLASFINNNRIKTQSNIDLLLFKKNTLLFKLYETNMNFNKNPKLKYNYVFNYSFDELTVIFNYYKNNSKLYSDESVEYNENIYTFITKLYKNALIIEMYEYIIGLCGLSIDSGAYLDISTIYVNNKITIDTIVNLYTILFRHFYNIINFAQPLNADINHFIDELYQKQYKNTKNKYNNDIGFVIDDGDDDEIDNEFISTIDESYIENPEEENEDILIDEDNDENEEALDIINNEIIFEKENEILELVVNESELIEAGAGVL